MEAPRPAATVVVAREGEVGPQVLVLRRGAGHRFLPGYVAFPGGSIDPQDHETAVRWFGSTEHTARACALRELAEELGLAFTAGGLVAAADPISLVEASPPASADVVEISRWVAPLSVPVRFDARFFAIAARSEVEPRPDGIEASDAWWTEPRALLSGGADLYHPTRSVLEAIAGCADVRSILQLRVPQVEMDVSSMEGSA